MAEIMLFHHAHGQTDGFLAFADMLRQAGHEVHTPDLFDGHTFPTVDEGVAHAEQVGFNTLIDRGTQAANRLSRNLVDAGFSLGVMPAQSLAQTRSEAQGALLFHSCAPVSAFGMYWPDEMPVQIHAMESDSWFTDDGDIDAAHALVESAEQAELFLYPGDKHLFADPSLPSYDKEASALLTERALSFLSFVDREGAGQ